jgi:hypothetical protein
MNDLPEHIGRDIETGLGERIEEAIEWDGCLGPDSPTTHARVMAVVQPELDQRDAEIKRLRESAGIWERAAQAESQGHTDTERDRHRWRARAEQAKATIARAKELATTWAALASNDEWADNVTDTLTADFGRAVLAALDQPREPSCKS